MGPNDDRHVVWTLGGFFFSFLSFLYTNQRFLFYLGSIYGFKLTKTVWMGGEEETGPKQGQTRRFGLGYFILFYSCFYILTNVFWFIQVLSTFEKHEEGLDGWHKQKR